MSHRTDFSSEAYLLVETDYTEGLFVSGGPLAMRKSLLAELLEGSAGDRTGAWLALVA